MIITVLLTNNSMQHVFSSGQWHDPSTGYETQPHLWQHVTSGLAETIKAHGYELPQYPGEYIEVES